MIRLIMIVLAINIGGDSWAQDSDRLQCSVQCAQNQLLGYKTIIENQGLAFSSSFDQTDLPAIKAFVKMITSRPEVVKCFKDTLPATPFQLSVREEVRVMPDYVYLPLSGYAAEDYLEACRGNWKALTRQDS